uniref:Olfactory receptor n=1 Tax=Sphaeramia orbicularis TaxID=375764 RepID=A0A673BCX3_9TELE
MIQADDNYTQVSAFVIVGFPSLQPEYFDIVGWFFFFLYVTIVLGNLLLVVVFALEHSIQKPMYIIMLSLALSDIGFPTVALPKLIARYWWNDGRLSFQTCLFQRHMIHYFGSLNSLILLTMALDRYFAICFPLRYPTVMTNQTMTGLTVLTWVVAHIFPSVSSYHIPTMLFCGLNKIMNVFCDTRSVVALVCGDISRKHMQSFATALFILYAPLSLIVISYIALIVTVLHVDSGKGLVKTFSTFATQGCIISIYYIPRFFVYAAPFFPSLTMTPDKRIAATLFYSLFPPLINPFIYCLRTKEIKQILRRWIQKRKSPQSPTVCSLNAVSKL